MAAKIFVSYSHKDHEYKELLVRHLGVVARTGRVETWDDGDIRTGDEWRKNIERSMQEASIAILLISKYSLTSKFILEVEVPLLLKLQAEGLRLIPILVGHCLWEEVAWLSGIQIYPRDGVAIGDLAPIQQDRPIKELAIEILKLLDDGAVLKDSRNTTAPILGTMSRRVFQPSPPIGREEERDEALTILRDHRALLLYGAPGQGKTELARYIAVSSAGLYPDGIYEVDLQSEKQIDNVPQHIGAALSDGDRSDALKFLQSKEALVILDSFELLLRSSERDKIRQFLTLLIDQLDRGSRVIITSQEKFDKSGLVPKAVRRLDRRFAEDLFHRESRDLHRGHDKDSITSFVDGVLAGHPLSIKIVARYSSIAGIDFDTLCRLWNEKWRAIANFQPSFDDKELWTAFELSYSSLAQDEQLFFLAMSLLPDGIDSSRIVEIWGGDLEATVYRSLGTLEERSLLESGQGRFRKMLGPIFQFSNEKMRGVRDGHPLQSSLNLITEDVDRFYDSFVERYAPQASDEDPREKNILIRNHFHNIHASLDRRLDPSTKPATLGAANSVLRLYWAYHNNLSGYKNAIASAEDAVNYLEEARDIFDINKHNDESVRCAYYIGVILWLRGSIDRALPYLREALESGSSSPEIKCDCKRAFAHIEYKSGSLKRSIELYEEVVSEADAIGYDECRVKCQVGLIDAYRKAEDFDKGIECFGSLKSSLASVYPSTKGNVIRGYAYILSLMGRAHEAEAQYKEALEIFSSVSVFGQAHCSRGLGDVYVQLGRLDEAESQFDLAMRLYDEARKNPSLGVGLVELGRGKLALARKDITKAVGHFREAVRLFDRKVVNEPFELARAHEHVGDVQRRALQVEEALGNYELALSHYQRVGTEIAADRVRKKISEINQR
jgi:tetratricopeptide (TPR) repeat protein